MSGDGDALISGFKHELLPQNSIRLITLSADLKDGRPDLSIKAYARAEAPDYICMSYCWGPGPESKCIYLNHHQFPSRPNLSQLLLHMRHHCLAYPEWQYFWIDAICINQSDGEEKTEQVGRMDETYRNAITVAAWLGMPEESEDKEMHGRDHRFKLSSPAFVDEIVRSPYWSRMWIVQELILAKEIVLLYGHARLPWEMAWGILQAWSTLGKSRWRNSAAASLVQLGVGRVGASYIQKQGRALGELMRYLEHSEATDSRDRVFALLGLMEAEERRFISTIFPDYTMSHEKVMLVTMTYLKQIYAPRPFRWIFKPRQVWGPDVFGLDGQTWEAMWSETEAYRTPHDLTNYAYVWNAKAIGKLLIPGQSAKAFCEQKAELRKLRQQWLDARADALHRLARESKR
ncbi:HET-domain-containing protein [Hypoxylon sp. FL1150]|nr:HET-domain-containing protein [Hypoxylon sp. FL1150]